MLRKSARATGARLKGLPFQRMIPNMVTLLALSAGLSSIRFSAQESWEKAVIAIIVAGILDGLDGRVARLLRGTSKFGAELDSLSDFLSFGVAPAILIYFWAPWGGVYPGWTLSILFCVCCALRLARFNTMLEDAPQPVYWQNFFTGVPSPAGGLIAILPVMLYLHFEESFLRTPIISGLFLFIAGILMVSKVPTFSLKKLRVPMAFVVPILLFVGITAGLTVNHPWATLSFLTVIYLLSIPVSIRVFMFMKKAVEEPIIDVKENL